MSYNEVKSAVAGIMALRPKGARQRKAESTKDRVQTKRRIDQAKARAEDKAIKEGTYTMMGLYLTEKDKISTKPKEKQTTGWHEIHNLQWLRSGRGEAC